jgi:hypothetical protein
MAGLYDKSTGLVTLSVATDEVAENITVDCLVFVAAGANGTATVVSSLTGFTISIAVLANNSLVIPFGDRGKTFRNGLKLSAVSGLTVYAMISKAGR